MALLELAVVLARVLGDLAGGRAVWRAKVAAVAIMWAGSAAASARQASGVSHVSSTRIIVPVLARTVRHSRYSS